MLLSKISEELVELSEIVKYEKFFDTYKTILNTRGERRNILLQWSIEMRNLLKGVFVLENKKFESNIVKRYVGNYLNYVNNIFSDYDRLINILPWEEKKEVKDDIEASIVELCDAIGALKKVVLEVRMVDILILNIIEETWEPLPDDKKEDNVNNIIVSSEARSISLNDVASDVDNLDRFFNGICSLIGQDKNEDNNIYLRKVETGSLTVAVSCVIGTEPITKFMFWLIELCQNTAKKSLINEKKRLINEENKLKIINDNMNKAKEILKISPDNKEADEAIQRCGVHLLNFLENNPTGTINGEYYDIGIEKLKIEDKEENK